MKHFLSDSQVDKILYRRLAADPIAWNMGSLGQRFPRFYDRAAQRRAFRDARLPAVIKSAMLESLR